MEESKMRFLENVAEEMVKLLPITNLEEYFTMIDGWSSAIQVHDRKAFEHELSHMGPMSLEEAKELVDGSFLVEQIESFTNYVFGYEPRNWAAWLLFRKATHWR